MIEAIINYLKESDGKGILLLVVLAIFISLINVSPTLYTEYNKTKKPPTINKNHTALLVYQKLGHYNKPVLNHFKNLLDSEFQLSETDFLVHVNQGLSFGWESVYREIDSLPICVDDLGDFVRKSLLDDKFKIDIVRILTDRSQTREFKLILINNVIQSYQQEAIEQVRARLEGEPKCKK